MKNNPSTAATQTNTKDKEQRNLQQATIYKILLAVSFVHLFNDSIQAVIPAIFPILKDNLMLSFAQIGWISFALNMTSSVIQPVIGYAADRKPRPILLPLGMCSTFLGVLLLAYANNYILVLFSVMLIGFDLLPFIPKACVLLIWLPVSGKVFRNLYFKSAAMLDNL